MDQKQLVIRLAFLLVGTLGVGALAKRKNHNPWLWGGIGGISGLVTPLLILVPLLIVGFLRYRCPKCGAPVSNKDGRVGSCPNCAASATIAT